MPLLPFPRVQFFSDTGAVLSGGLLYSYQAGTSTAEPVYSNEALTVAHANPVALDAAGRAQIYLNAAQSYKFVLKTSAGVTVWTADNIRSAPEPSGEWTTPAYAAGNFTGSGAMTWTVDSSDIFTYQSTHDGDRMTVNWYLGSTSIGGTPDTSLRIAIPGGYVCAKYALNPCVYNDAGGGNTIGFAQVVPGGTVIQVFKLTSAAWSAAVNTTSVFGQITFETQ